MSGEHPYRESYIRIHQQNDGIRFQPKLRVAWGEGVYDYYVTTTVDFGTKEEREKQYKKVMRALEEENGIFFEYPSFSTGEKTYLRILGFEYLNETEGKLTVVMDQDDYNDWMGNSIPK